MNMKDYTATTISFSVITHLKLQNDVFHVKFFYTIVLLEENQISPFSNFIIINTQLIVDYLSFTHRQRWTFEHNRWKELSLGYSLWLSKKISNQIRVLLSVDQSEQWENREKKKAKLCISVWHSLILWIQLVLGLRCSIRSRRRGKENLRLRFQIVTYYLSDSDCEPARARYI